MKAIYLIIPMLLLLTISCKEEKEPQFETGMVTATLKSQSWEGYPEIHLDSDDSLTVLGIGNEEVITFKIKFTGKGTYLLPEKSATYYTTIGKDVMTSNYKSSQNSSSTVTITAYDEAKKRIEGSFEISLVQTYPIDEDETLTFSNGLFKGFIN
jgi:hypothetical protein